MTQVPRYRSNNDPQLDAQREAVRRRNRLDGLRARPLSAAASLIWRTSIKAVSLAVLLFILYVEYLRLK